MKEVFRCAIFALLCAYGHAQCCVGTITGMEQTMYSVQPPKSEVECYMRAAALNGNTNWLAACPTSCLALTCTGELGTSTGMLFRKLVMSCTTAESQTASIMGQETTMSQQGYSGVQCVQVAAATHTCSTNSSGVTSCACNPGYTASDGGPCSPCPYATYKGSIGQYSTVVLCCLSLYLSNVTHVVICNLPQPCVRCTEHCTDKFDERHLITSAYCRQ